MKPLLAAKADLSKICYPVLVSPKLDGVRALVLDEVVMSRAMKPIPNRWVQKKFGLKKLNGLDGELIVGFPWEKDCYRRTSSGVMSVEGEPTVVFHAFDFVTDFDISYEDRRKALTVHARKFSGFEVLGHAYVFNEQELLAYEQTHLNLGYEGVMIRDPQGIYKQGRSTVNEGILLKLKRFEDSEAEIIEIIELQHNDNPTFKGELGQTKRTSHKAGRRGGATMGSLKVKDVKTGVVFEIGTGFDALTRKCFWDKRHEYPGLLVKYKFFAGGVKDKPRFPVFLGFRNEGDM